ncbi:helix-turn-helix domain-containing protein [Ralstonia solanacearum]|uniref:Putative transcriptional regulators, LysR family n=1 Tax=Ralstonia solanacearum CFBP2957 TaxID=859656 RepID=D8P3S2_RALSL|nr:putative transcriptional regulators, LysR family [Ralstonia solanacearum CFBP2957]
MDLHASKLQTTRSNVSHRLKAFERALGVQLLRSTTRRVDVRDSLMRPSPSLAFD